MNISQRKDYDSEFCGSIPLNFINLVQPHGLLVVMRKAQLEVVQLSENFEDMVGSPVKEVLNKPLSDFVDAKHLEGLERKISRWNVTDKIPANLRFKITDKVVDFKAIVHFKENHVIMELEPEHEDEDRKMSFDKVYQEIKYIMAAMKKGRSMEEIGAIATAEIRKLSEFDRVLLYKFDPDWNGSVLSESKIDSLESFKGLHFPASDVPKQARDLYFKNPFRLIPNREYAPAKLIPVINPVTNSFTDLSECNLRSVPKVHIEYLENMGVKASMSIPIIVNEVLWGLISCHHQEPKYLNFEMRSAFELISNVVSAQIAAKENEKRLGLKAAANEINLRILEQMYAKGNFISGLIHGEVNLLDLIHATGGAIIYNNDIHKIGQTPSDRQILDIVLWLQRHDEERIYLTDSLPAVFEKSIAYKDVGSGLMAIPIGSKKGNFILGFRGELIKTVAWGGDPNEAINFEPGGKVYHPRNSFAVWKETVKFTSSPWQQIEVESAEVLRTSVLEKIVRDQN